MKKIDNKGLSDEAKKEIDHWLKKYPEDKKQSAVFAALKFVQNENKGYLTEGLMNAVAEYLEIPPIAVYEVATFYTMYDLKPMGRHKIRVCTNVSCALSGCDKIVSHLEKRLGVKMGEVTRDKKFSLRPEECLAACTKAPMMMIDETYHENLTPEKIDSILESYK